VFVALFLKELLWKQFEFMSFIQSMLVPIRVGQVSKNDLKSNKVLN